MAENVWDRCIWKNAAIAAIARKSISLLQPIARQTYTIESTTAKTPDDIIQQAEKERADTVYQKAYDEAFEEAYAKEYVQLIVDPDIDLADARANAKESAKETAKEAVKEFWKKPS